MEIRNQFKFRKELEGSLQGGEALFVAWPSHFTDFECDDEGTLYVSCELYADDLARIAKHNYGVEYVKASTLTNGMELCCVALHPQYGFCYED